VVRREGGPVGFLTSRAGARAAQVGPCVGDAAAGPLLLADAWCRHAGRRVYVDVPEANMAAVRSAAAAGLAVQRHLTRMSRGAPLCEDVGRLWASSGPEMG
jgi:hypothetical protein